MECPLDSAQLTLLSKLQAPELLNKFRALVLADGEMTLAEVGPASGQAFDIVYCGVTFVVSIAQNLSDFSGLKPIFCNLDPAQIHSAVGFRLGSHVAGGERVPAVVQALLDVGRKIGLSLDVTATVWHPANIVSGFDYFSQSVADYLSGGAFPVLALVNFKSEPSGLIVSRGLSALAGQELQIECGSMPEGEVMRRVVRVAHDIATNGPVCAPVTLDGLDANEKVELNPESESGIVTMKTRTVLKA